MIIKLGVYGQLPSFGQLWLYIHRLVILLYLILIYKYNLFSSPTQHYRITRQRIVHYSLLQPPRESGSYCIPTRLSVLSTSQKSQACRHLPYQLPNFTKLNNQHVIFPYQVFNLTILFISLPLSLFRHFNYNVRLHVSGKLLAFSRARIELFFKIKLPYVIKG